MTTARLAQACHLDLGRQKENVFSRDFLIEILENTQDLLKAFWTAYFLYLECPLPICQSVKNDCTEAFPGVPMAEVIFHLCYPKPGPWYVLSLLQTG